MSCPSNPIDCVGAVVSPIVGGVASSALDSFADSIKTAVASLVKATLTWWLQQDSVDVSSTPIGKLQALLLPVTLVVAVAGVMTQGIRMALSRKPDPLYDVVRGLATLAFVTGAGVAVLAGSLKAGDSLSTWMLNQSTGGQFSSRLVDVLSMQAITAPGTVILLGFVIFFVTLLQWVLLFFRQGSLIILAALLPLAAAGSMSQSTRPWLRRLLAWMLSIVAYKPMVAFIYAAGFTLFGSGNDLSTVVLGVVVLILSVVALPALLRFFSWGVDAGAAHLGSAASGALVGGIGAATAAVNIAGSRSGGAAADQAASISQSLPARTSTSAGSVASGAGMAGVSPVLAGVGAAASAAKAATGKVADAFAGSGAAAEGGRS